ncbi:MAG: hybrid sensor histidine kinase/response regulator [Myxococcota bacterium]
MLKRWPRKQNRSATELQALTNSVDEQRDSQRPDPAFALVDDALAAESLRESYAQLRVSWYFRVIIIGFTFVALRIIGEAEHFATWLAVLSVGLVFSAAASIAYQKGCFKTADAARNVRRASALISGASWGFAGVLWPVTFEGQSWIVFVGIYAILASGVAVTMATDPISFVLFVVSTMAVALWNAEIEPISWGAASIVTYNAFCFVTLLRNRAVFRNMVNLRLENSELLQQALASASAAERARDQAVVAANDKARFLAAASHDLRQPMQALTLLSETLERSATGASDAVRKTASSITHAALELTTLFEGILDLSQLELGHINNDPKPVRIRGMLQDIADGMLLDAEAREMTVSVAGPDLIVHAEPVLLWRVIANLANNAMLHSESDRILLSARSRGDHCLIQVWDQGKGIAEEDQERIFEDFLQLENPERRRDRGTGLGLSIVRHVCVVAGWQVGVTSRLGRGSMFSIRVPTSTSMPASVEPSEEQPVDVRGLRVLVIEDDELVLRSLTSALEASGASVTTATSAEAAFDCIATDAPLDVVLSDYRLPRHQTGMDIARCLSTSRPTVPCILLTGELQEIPDADGFPTPTVIRKPASHHAICMALRDACGTQAAPDRVSA